MSVLCCHTMCTQYSITSSNMKTTLLALSSQPKTFDKDNDKKVRTPFEGSSYGSQWSWAGGGQKLDVLPRKNKLGILNIIKMCGVVPVFPPPGMHRPAEKATLCWADDTVKECSVFFLGWVRTQMESLFLPHKDASAWSIQLTLAAAYPLKTWIQRLHSAAWHKHYIFANYSGWCSTLQWVIQHIPDL